MEDEDHRNPTVCYTYDAFDNMTEIVRGDGMKYVLAYNEFHNLESIGVDGKAEKLVQYSYKTGNGRLKAITYANGDTMKASYNSIGQMIAEKWFDKDNVLKAHYKYTYDGQGNIVRSIDMLAQKEYNYEYEEGRILRATEANVVFSGEMVVGKTLVNEIRYFYDAEGTMTKKVVTPVGGAAQTIYYESTDDNTVVKFMVPDPKVDDPDHMRAVVSHSKTDSFGRKVFDELQLGTGFVSRQFQYQAGEVTQEHVENGKLKSTPTTQLVSQITFADGGTLVYKYDEEERIRTVVETYEENGDQVINTTEYTYDALGQLLTETVNETEVNTMTYDNYGNILKKNDAVYAYKPKEEGWSDLLIKVGEGDDRTITYDDQGNPLTYLGHTLTWEKGRQLKSFDSNTYTYNANGIRTSKTVAGVKHDYLLDGTKILRECWNYDEVTKTYQDILIPLYDNEDSVCGIVYNNTPYYFIKNLQGDVISIVDKNGEPVARYCYDAWGVPTIAQDTSACSIATINPFRYRSYYFDKEIGLYYLQSRYYDPQLARFINADVVQHLGGVEVYLGYNLFIYCENSPVSNADSFGNFSWAVFGDMIKRIAELAKELLKYVLEKYGLTKRVYAQRKKFKRAHAILVFVNENKKAIKNLKATATGIGHFVDVVLTVADYAIMLKGNRNTMVKIADTLFYGIIRIIGYMGSEFISWLVSKIIKVLCWARFFIERLLNILLDAILNSKWVEKLKEKYLAFIEAPGITVGDYIVAVFKGAKACVT